jgi:DNA helicase HerA-like ATPase
VNHGELAFPLGERGFEEGRGKYVGWDERGLEDVLIFEKGIGRGEVRGIEIAAIEILRWDPSVSQGPEFLRYTTADIEELGWISRRIMSLKK